MQMEWSGETTSLNYYHPSLHASRLQCPCFGPLDMLNLSVFKDD